MDGSSCKFHLRMYVYKQRRWESQLGKQERKENRKGKGTSAAEAKGVEWSGGWRVGGGECAVVEVQGEGGRDDMSGEET